MFTTLRRAGATAAALALGLATATPALAAESTITYAALDRLSCTVEATLDGSGLAAAETLTPTVDGTPVAGAQVEVPAGDTATYTFELAAYDDRAVTLGFLDPDGTPDDATTEVAVDCATAPVARDDTARTDAGEPVTVDVLANDDDADGQPLTVTVTAQPANGTAQIVAGGLRYVPAAGFTGRDSLEYTVTDPDGLTGTAAVTIDVTAAPPAAPSVTASLEFCADSSMGVGGVVLVTVTNTADETAAARTYQVSLAGETQTVRDLPDGESAELPFWDVPTGTHTVTVIGDDGSRAETTVEVSDCPPVEQSATIDVGCETDGAQLTGDVLVTVTLDNTAGAAAEEFLVVSLVDQDLPAVSAERVPAGAVRVVETTFAPTEGREAIVGVILESQLAVLDEAEFELDACVVPDAGDAGQGGGQPKPPVADTGSPAGSAPVAAVETGGEHLPAVAAVLVLMTVGLAGRLRRAVALR